MCMNSDAMIRWLSDHADSRLEGDQKHFLYELMLQIEDVYTHIIELQEKELWLPTILVLYILRLISPHYGLWANVKCSLFPMSSLAFSLCVYCSSYQTLPPYTPLIKEGLLSFIRGSSPGDCHESSLFFLAFFSFEETTASE